MSEKRKAPERTKTPKAIHQEDLVKRYAPIAVAFLDLNPPDEEPGGRDISHLLTSDYGCRLAEDIVAYSLDDVLRGKIYEQTKKLAENENMTFDGLNAEEILNKGREGIRRAAFHYQSEKKDGTHIRFTDFVGPILDLHIEDLLLSTKTSDSQRLSSLITKKKYDELLNNAQNILAGTTSVVIENLSRSDEFFLFRLIEEKMSAEKLLKEKDSEMTLEQKKVLDQKIELGKKVTELMTLVNNGLVHKEGNSYTRNDQYEGDDYLQEERLGILTALVKFDRFMGNKFSTYATWWLKQSLKRYHKNEPLHLPEYVMLLKPKIIAILAERPKISKAALAKELNMSLYTLKSAWPFIHSPLSLDQEDEGGSALGENLPSVDPGFEKVNKRSDIEPIKKALATKNKKYGQYLNKIVKFPDLDRDLQIFLLRYPDLTLEDDALEFLTFEAIGNKFKITRERVRQIVTKQLRWLRGWKERYGNEDDLPPSTKRIGNAIGIPPRKRR